MGRTRERESVIRRKKEEWNERLIKISRSSDTRNESKVFHRIFDVHFINTIQFVPRINKKERSWKPRTCGRKGVRGRQIDLFPFFLFFYSFIDISQPYSILTILPILYFLLFLLMIFSLVSPSSSQPSSPVSSSLTRFMCTQDSI